ncbi:MAG TPA: methyltransferase domain-containing protein [Terracidiphilus sp.]|jgi:ubiquinone/menaquinone biosynthesis C-methylase UbiE|nr:methyltransferase domain-containing protein [Terracidiphilus sp.]
MSSQHHQSDPRVLNRRTLAHDHRHLASLLKPGMKVLDVGCGTGAITADIATRVGPSGSVHGIDRDATLIVIAQNSHSAIPNLTFEVIDVLALSTDRRYDLVTTARTLQWISEPVNAIRKMVQCLIPQGVIALLDFNHEEASWVPSAPREFMAFYSAFLEWRKSHHWMNDIAEHLGDMLRQADVADIQVLSADERISREHSDFEDRATIWVKVIESLGSLIQKEKLLSASDLQRARESYLRFVKIELEVHTIKMREAIGTYNQ